MIIIPGLLCFWPVILILLVIGGLFLFARDFLWNKEKKIDGMIPVNYERTREWDFQMIAVGFMLFISGLLCLGFSIIGIAFR